MAETRPEKPDIPDPGIEDFVTPEVDENELLELIGSALAARDSGDDLDVSRLCGGRVHYAEALRSALDGETSVSTWANGHDADELIGITLAGRYEVEAQIGAGAMGSVYVAMDRNLKRRVAIKLMNARFAVRGDAAARFEREAETLASIRHPNVVQVYDRGITADERPYLVMEYLRGYSLARVVALIEDRAVAGRYDVFAATAWLREACPDLTIRGESAIRQYVLWLSELASGLAEAHRLGVSHRDVKPSNIFLTLDGRAVLVDFGLAVRSADATLTMSAATVGTPAYMPPEQAVGRASRMPVVDVYSLAATAYHLLSGMRPYAGDTEDVLAALRAGPPESLYRIAPKLPRDLAAIVQKGIERVPSDRYAHAGELSEELSAFLEHRPVRARQIGFVDRSWRWMKRSVVARAALVAITAALGAVAILLSLQQREASSEDEFWEQLAGIPVAFGMHSVDYTNEGPALERIQSRLARGLELRPDDLWMRTMRMCNSLDLERSEAVLRDLEHVVKRLSVDFGSGVSRYVSAQAGARAVTRADLAEPTTDEDRYVYAVLSLRDGDFESCLSASNAATGFLAADALLIYAKVTSSVNTGQRRWLLEIERDIENLHTRTGRALAWTGTLRGQIYNYRGEARSALEQFERTLELSPECDMTRVFLSQALQSAGQSRRAVKVLELCHGARGLGRAASTRATLFAGAKRFDKALACTKKILGYPAAERERLLAEASIHRLHAANLQAKGHPKAVVAPLLEKAKACYSEALPMVKRSVGKIRTAIDLAIVQFGLDRDPIRVRTALLRAAAKLPKSSALYRNCAQNIAGLMRGELLETDLNALRDYFLAASRSPKAKKQ